MTRLSSFLLRLVSTVLFGGTMLSLVGCHPAATAPIANSVTAPPLNIIAVDRSGSTQHMRANQVSAARAMFARAAKWNEEVAVYTVDRKTACVMAPTVLRAGQQPPASVLRELETPTKDRATRTRPAQFWQEMASEYGTASPSAKSRVVRIFYLTDGGNDWAEEDAQVVKAVKQLAGNKDIYVGLLGVNKDLFKPITDQFEPLGEKRLVVSVGGDRETMIPGIAALREKGDQ